jgi:hypothetical protein
MKRIGFILFLTFSLLFTTPALLGQCQAIGGVLMTNIGAINGAAVNIPTNLGPVFGDLQGSVAATILGQDANGNYLVQHYWVNSSGETILFKQAVLKPVATSDPYVTAVLWGNYKAYIVGGTGKFKNASGMIDCFGLADFRQNTLVLRYRGTLCLPPGSNTGQ